MRPEDDKQLDGELRAPSSNPPGGRVPPSDESPGVPGFRTWRGVYVFVFAMFVLMVIGLALFSRHFG